MASVRIGAATESGTSVTMTGLDDAQAASLVIWLGESFERQGGAWLGGPGPLTGDGLPDSGKPYVVWVPRTASVTAEFDGDDLPSSVALLTAR